jgi:hypothetical protein
MESFFWKLQIPDWWRWGSHFVGRTIRLGNTDNVLLLTVLYDYTRVRLANSSKSITSLTLNVLTHKDARILDDH